MTDDKSVIRNACRVVLRPLATMFLRCGMTWREFSDLSKSVFVQTATEEYGISGRPTNVSRVSILTGISRKEVKRQRDLLKDDIPVAETKTTDATRVLSGWYQDTNYLDDARAPENLAEHGPSPSFQSLCEQYGGDIAPTTLLKELLTTNTVERTEDGKIRPLRRYYQPAVRDDATLNMVVGLVKDLIETGNNNIFADDSRTPRFGGYADNDSIAADTVPKFRAFLDDRGQDFLEEIDDWLSKHATGNDERTKKVMRVGVGLFAIEETKNVEQIK